MILGVFMGVVTQSQVRVFTPYPAAAEVEVEAAVPAEQPLPEQIPHPARVPHRVQCPLTAEKGR